MQERARAARMRFLDRHADAVYDDRITLDAASLEPVVTWGINPGQSVPVSGHVPHETDADGQALRLGRDSLLAGAGEQREGRAFVAYEERSFEVFRAYYAFLPRGRHAIEYTLRLNNPGRFGVPPTRVEAMYAPEVYGEAPNAALEVLP